MNSRTLPRALSLIVLEKRLLTQPFFMKSILFIATVFLFFACKNNNSGSGTMQSTDSAKAVASPDLTKEEEAEFMSNCVEVAKARLNGDEKKAYASCNCMLNQIKEKYPNLDSAQAMLQDSVQVRQLQKNCQ